MWVCLQLLCIHVCCLLIVCGCECVYNCCACIHVCYLSVDGCSASVLYIICVLTVYFSCELNVSVHEV